MKTLRSLSLWVLSLGLLSVAGCDTVKTSDENIERIEYKQVVKMLADAKDKAVLLDVRPRKQYEAEHLPEARHIALPDLVAEDERLGDARRIIVYGTDFRDPLSPAAAKKLTVLGYRHVFDFRGGVEAWKAAGGRTITAGVETDATSP